MQNNILTIPRSDLLEPLNSAASLTPSRTTIPILGFLRIEAEGHTLKISATDMDMWIARKIELEDATAIAPICVEAARFADVVRGLPAEAILKIEILENDKCHISAGKSRYNIPTLPASDYPVIPDRKFKQSFSMSAKEIAAMLRKVQHSSSADEIRFYLNGAHIFHSADKICVETSDGHRLTKTFACLQNDEINGMDFILPRLAVNYFIKILDIAPDRNALIEISERIVQLSINDIVFISKLVDGAFPETSRIIPASFEGSIKLNRVQLIRATERLKSFLSTEKTRLIKLTLEKDFLVLDARNPTGDGQERVDIIAIDISGGEWGINSQYLIDALLQMKGEEVTLSLTSPVSPLFSLTDSDDTETIYIVMGVKI